MSGLQHVKNMKRMAVINGQVVPARDLTADEVKKYGGQKALIASGLYQQYKAATKKQETKKPTSKKEKGD